MLLPSSQACHGRCSARDDAGEPILSRRIRSSSPAGIDFVEPGTSPPCELLQRRVKLAAGETDTRAMDAQGARSLAARIRAGVSIGTRIELVRDPSDDSGLCAGDRGVVDDIDDRGNVHVIWDRGFASEIDPESTPIHPLAA
jgi:Domain of unknown function (DUF4314)